MNDDDLKNKLLEIKNNGFVKSMRKGNTGVGYTLESLLGIDENNDASADIDDRIELKAKRKTGKARVTSFCQSFLWLRDKRKTILEYGNKLNDKRINFYVNLRHGPKSSRGLGLKINSDSVFITNKEDENIAELPIEVIVFRFRQKFKELVLVSAESEKKRGEPEEFWYNEAYHCKDLSKENIINLLNSGKITFETRMWLNPETGKLRDRGTAVRLTDRWTKELFDKVDKIL